MSRSSVVRSLLLVLALPVLLGAARARLEPRDDPPPAPRPRAVAGRIMLASDFRQAASLDSLAPDRDGVWSIAHGALRARLPDKKHARSFIYAGSEEWAEYAVELDVWQTRCVDEGLA